VYHHASLLLVWVLVSLVLGSRVFHMLSMNSTTEIHLTPEKT
jgi:hypothetical protein